MNFNVTLAQGIPGRNGNLILSGIVPPSNGIGANGDYYIDTVGLMLYGPKALGVWPAGISLQSSGGNAIVAALIFG